ncbi:MAG: 50S ribosomal protein L25 [Akkermansia sp.]
MATSHSLKAEARACGSGNLKQLRSQGLVPGVVYGPGFDNVNIQVDAREFSRMLASAVSEHILVALDIDGKVVKVLLKEIQHNPITNACLHVDFQAVKDSTVIHSIVPVILEGDPAGVALGGVLDQTIHELSVTCQVKDLPESIKADVSGLKIGESLSIADLKLPAGVNTELAGDVIVAIVEAPRVSSEEAAPPPRKPLLNKRSSIPFPSPEPFLRLRAFFLSQTRRLLVKCKISIR